jgi:hypothetical protein
VDLIGTKSFFQTLASKVHQMANTGATTEIPNVAEHENQSIYVTDALAHNLLFFV